MNIFVAGTLFAVIILIYVIISELFTMLFRATGLPDDKARFQVLSLLTGAGFTTKESEMLLSSKARRRLAQITMLFGYVFNVSIVSALVNVFLSLKKVSLDQVLAVNIVPLVIVAMLIILIRVRFVRKQIDRLFGSLAGRIMHQQDKNTILLMDYIGHESIANVILKEVPEAFRGKTLAELELKSRYNIMVMLVERDGYKVEQATASTVFLPGDRLTVFGRYKTIVSEFQAYERFS